MAYKGLSNPVEGTMLTVMREAASAAKKQASDGSSDVISVLEATVDASRDSVANTPNLLSVLKEAGVVDAGGDVWDFVWSDYWSWKLYGSRECHNLYWFGSFVYGHSVFGWPFSSFNDDESKMGF